MMPQQYCLRWKHHHSNVQSMFSQLLEKERFCDVTLYCSPSFASQVSNKDTVEPQSIRGVSLRAHRVVLAACSELLGALLGAHEAHGEPVLVIDGAEPRHLKALLDYMYTGEMNVHHSQLASLLKTAEELRIKGLTDIRWNNKDEPPDCEAGVVATPTAATEISPPKVETQVPKQPSPKQTSSPRHVITKQQQHTGEAKPMKKENGNDTERHGERFNVNGGPPPLIKLPLKEKSSPIKREHSDTDSPSPKRQRAVSATEHTDDETHSSVKMEQDQEWQHGNLDITAERVVGWGMGEAEGSESSREGSEDEWADAPTDIGSFLHTKLRVDGDNSADEESNDSGAGPACRSTAASSSSSAAASTDIKVETSHGQVTHHPTKGSKSGPSDPRFSDVVKLSDYLQHGRRPQFWEENYVKRVMEAVRVKDLEMKQAAEILGVSYGTLYGRYRDVYGCINRPYSNMSALHLMASTVPSKIDGDRSEGNRHQQSTLASRLATSTAKATRAVRDFWQAKGPTDVLDRLQRGDISLDAAARALGVTMANLAAHVADFGHGTTDFEPIPIEVDPSLKMRPRTYSSEAQMKSAKKGTPTAGDKGSRKLVIGRLIDEDPIPATVITMHEGKPFPSPPVTTSAPATTTTTPSGKWPSIRVASIDTLRGAGAGESVASPPPPAPIAPTSPSQLMRTRPDLTIVAARKPDTRRDDEDT